MPPVAGLEVRGRHVVKLYADDEDLVRSASSHLEKRSRSDGTAIVIATPAHARAIARSITGPRLILDAAETLAKFMVDGVPDPDAFESAVGTVVRRAADGGGTARAYGEMVAVLWEAGNVTGAMELERLWNALLDDVDLSLLCAYPASIVDGPVDSVREVCGLHTDVDGARLPDLRRRFPPSDGSPRAARHFVAEVLPDWDLAHLVDDVATVVGEFATNAVVHAGSPFDVALSRVPGGLRAEVSDRSSVLPALTRPRFMGGRGLVLVDRLASRWGAGPSADGKRVWAEFVGPDARSA